MFAWIHNCLVAWHEMNSGNRLTWGIPRLAQVQLEWTFHLSLPCVIVTMLCLAMGMTHAALMLSIALTTLLALSTALYLGTLMFIVCRNAAKAARYFSDPTHEAE